MTVRLLSRPSLVAMLGVVLLLAGCLMAWLAQRQGSPAFGWFAYAPLSDARMPDYLPSPADPLRLRVGLGLAGLGLAVSGFGLGYLAGRRGPATR